MNDPEYITLVVSREELSALQHAATLVDLPLTQFIIAAAYGEAMRYARAVDA